MVIRPNQEWSSDQLIQDRHWPFHIWNCKTLPIYRKPRWKGTPEIPLGKVRYIIYADNFFFFKSDPGTKI